MSALALLFIYKNYPYASASRPAYKKEPKKGLATNLNLIVVCSSSINRKKIRSTSGMRHSEETDSSASKEKEKAEDGARTPQAHGGPRMQQAQT